MLDVYVLHFCHTKQSALVHNGGHPSVADDSGAANHGNITL